MTEPNETRPPPPLPQPTLPYRSGIDDRRDLQRPAVALQALAGFFVGALTVVGGGFVGAITSTHARWAFLTVVVVATAVPLTIAYMLTDHERQRGWPIGLCLGVGVALLLEGACYLMLMA